MDTCDHAIICTYKYAYFTGLIFTVNQLSAKTTKLNPSKFLAVQYLLIAKVNYYLNHCISKTYIVYTCTCICHILCTEKDSVRTDCQMDYFGGERGDENIEALKRILGTYALYDPQLGIVHIM